MFPEYGHMLGFVFVFFCFCFLFFVVFFWGGEGDWGGKEVRGSKRREDRNNFRVC